MHDQEPESELPARSPADPLDERLLDLLVDGELSPAETRELLARCEDRPEAWRRCALAFLEAQAFRRGMGSLRSEPATPVLWTSPVAPAASSAPPAQPAGRGRSVTTWLALAASVVCAFLVGLEARDWWRPAVNDPPVAIAPPAPVQPAPQAQLVGRNTLAGGLTLEGAGADRSALHVPVYTGPDANEAWLRNLPAQVPAELQRLLQSSGRRVEVRREIIPIDLGDGQQVIVPVDELEVQIEPRAYQ